MTKFSDHSIEGSGAELLCFASSSMLTPSDIHGEGKDALPMEKISTLASSLSRKERNLPGLFAANILRAREIYQQTKHMPFIFVQMRDGILVSPFFVRRHQADVLSPYMIAQSCISLFTYIIGNASSGNIVKVSLERPVDAGKEFDIMVSMLPDNVTIHKEDRDVSD